MISLDLSRVTENSTLISVLMTCSSAWMESALLDPNGGQRWVIYDEAWRLMSHPALLRRMDAHWRLARHYGIANMLIFHKLTDLDNVGDQGSAMRSPGELTACERRDPDRLPPGVRPARADRDRARPDRDRAAALAEPRRRPRAVADQGQELRLPAPTSPRRTRTVRHQQPRSRRPPMNLTSPRRSGPNDDDATAPVELPHVLVTVAADGTLAAMVDGTPFASPEATRVDAGDVRAAHGCHHQGPHHRSPGRGPRERRDRLHRHPPYPQAPTCSGTDRGACAGDTSSRYPGEFHAWLRSRSRVRAR